MVWLEILLLNISTNTCARNFRLGIHLNGVYKTFLKIWFDLNLHHKKRFSGSYYNEPSDQCTKFGDPRMMGSGAKKISWRLLLRHHRHQANGQLFASRVKPAEPGESSDSIHSFQKLQIFPLVSQSKGAILTTIKWSLGWRAY